MRKYEVITHVGKIEIEAESYMTSGGELSFEAEDESEIACFASGIWYYVREVKKFQEKKDGKEV